jgi:hypothetical protein
LADWKRLKSFVTHHVGKDAGKQTLLHGSPASKEDIQDNIYDKNKSTYPFTW